MPDRLLPRKTAPLTREEAVRVFRETDQFARTVLESSSDCIKILDLDGNLLTMTAMGCKMMEIDDFSLCQNTPWVNFWTDEGHGKALHALAEAREGRTGRFDGFCATAKGTPKWWEVVVTPIRDAEGVVSKLLSTARDVTERKVTQDRLEEALKEAKESAALLREMRIAADQNEENLKLAFESADFLGTWDWDIARNLIFAGPKFSVIFGFDPDQGIKGLPPADCFARIHRDDVPVVQAEIDKAMASRGVYQAEYRLIRPDGTYRWALARGRFHYDEAGQPQRFIGMVIDTTERKDLEEILRQNVEEQKRANEEIKQAWKAADAANLAKSEFLANMSHELRTPMNAIVGLTALLKTAPPAEKVRELVHTLDISSGALLSLINDLLDISKIEAKSIELEQVPFRFTDLVPQVISMVNVRTQKKGIELSVDYDGLTDRTYSGDANRIRQIVLNLCSNAIKFTDEGRIDLIFSKEPTSEPNVETIVLTVKDTGIGIAPANLEKVFQKFSQADASITRRFGGTGLGLPISRLLAETMGGTLTVESVVGKGSAFAVRLPLSVVETAPVAVQTTVPGDVVTEDRLRILLVEDYAPAAYVGGMYLETWGYDCTVAGDGETAVKQVLEGDYLAVLMDVQMGILSGFEATQAIRDHERATGKKPCWIIGMTAHALAGDRDRCIAAGMNDYLPKPFDPSVLLRKLSEAQKKASDRSR